MYFEINKVIKNYFDDEIIRYQDLYDIRMWPIGIGLDLKFPVQLEEENVYTSEFDQNFDTENHVLVKYGKLTGKYPIKKEKNFCKGFVYYILEATLFRGCCDENIICDKRHIKTSGKIFFTPFLDIFNHCCYYSLDDFDKPFQNLCNIVVKNQINPGIPPKKNTLIMAKTEYEKECIIREDYARERIIAYH